MGVPKFYRWISERYPNISRVINDNQIPDFDNFYLDMNGIIHACSHINEDNCEINVTEEEIFRNIFHYIDFLFRMIKPKKVFFMAVDGVAPRAKMNQQRARRFRAGRERIKKLETIANESGQPLDEIIAKNFDTNSITPGTPFMAQLNEQLKYFIHVKLTTDPLWENVDVHLSGHLTPGEGEHKIMEYIRYTRSQPEYDINTRHCLYGLDADLIMLGLVTHEMHFALLREEVKYGSKKISKIPAPEEITWQILHTCLLRDYIDLEFRSIKDKIKFPYDLESIVDDWILMGYLVGNDFIPHLPHFHINEEALSILWDTYKKVLPTLDGYMNESGELNLTRFEIYLTELAKFDHQRYANENDTFKHLAKLTGRNKNLSKNNSELNKDKDNGNDNDFNFALLDKLIPTTSTTSQKEDSNNNESLDQSSSNESKSVDLSLSSSSSVSEDDDDLSSDSDTLSDKSSSTISEIKNEDELENMPLIEAEFRQHKNHYYRDKMQINLTSSDQLKVYVEQYIIALQWILKYYYQGCPSWPWFYSDHYAPYLSDLKNFKHLKITFQLGTPFKPFEQLLSVLPPTSCSLLPVKLQPLMTDPNSPLLYFYPKDFKLDQNEKKRDWEAIVLLPFIDEQLLLNTITKYYNQLNPNEQILNQHLPSLCFKTTTILNPIGNLLGTNPYFPTLKETRAICQEFPIDYYLLDNHHIKHGRFEQKDMIIFPKFPVLNVLPYKFDYKNNAVSVFESSSKGTTLVLNLIHQSNSDCITYNNEWNPKNEKFSLPFHITNHKTLMERYLGKCVFVNWPHFQYGIVCAINDFQHLYTWTNIPGGSNFYFEVTNNEEDQDYKNYTQTPIYVSDFPFELINDNNRKVYHHIYRLSNIEQQIEYKKALNINRIYENRRGISIGPIPILLYVCPLIGYRTKCSSTSDKCRTIMCFSNQALPYPLQTTLFKIPNYKDDIDQFPQKIHDYFKINDPIFALKIPYYSSSGYVQHINKDNHGQYLISCEMKSSDTIDHPNIYQSKSKFLAHQLQYFTAQGIANQLNILPCIIAKITGKINVIGGNRGRRRANPTNIGFSWKVNKPVKQLHGYTKKFNDIWYYSTEAIRIISEYISKFPDIIAELTRKPNKDNYLESNIWPGKNGKHELQQVRTWIKNLPTYSMSLTSAAWEILDTPVVNEIEKFVNSFYEKRAAKHPNEKTKLVSFEPHYLFKANESFGMCDPDIRTTFSVFDRVVNVRLGTGVPIGTRGTVIGIMYGRTNLDTYYEVLFDNLPSNCLNTILLGKNQQKCRIKVHSYHLLNYSHSLRFRSMNYQHQQSVPPSHIEDRYSYKQTSTVRQHESMNIVKKDSDNENTRTKPKSAPPLSTHDNPNFTQVKEQKPITDDSTSPVSSIEQPSISIENPSSIPLFIENSPDPKLTLTPMNITMPTATPDSLLFHAIQDSEQLGNYQSSFETTPAIPPFQTSGPQIPIQQMWEPIQPQYIQAPFMNEPSGNMPQVPMYPFEQQSSMYASSQFQQPLSYPHFPPGMEPFNLMYDAPLICNEFNHGSPFPSYNLHPQGGYINYPTGSVMTSIPFNYEQQQQQQQQFPMQMQNPPMDSGQLPPIPLMSHESSTMQFQQQASTGLTNKAALKFIPSQMTTSTTTTSNTLIDSQLDCALDLMRRLPPQQVEKNLSDLIDLVPDLTEELLAAVDQPLKVVRDRTVGKDYLLCDYNRDGDSYRSPWTNTYTPPFDGNLPSDRLRHLEIEANQAFEQYREMYFEGGVSSVYFWDLENGFAGVVLIKKVGDGSKKIKGCWDSIHVIEVQEKQSGRTAHYKLTSTVMLWLQTHKTMSGMMNLGGSLTRQLEADHQITDFSQHIINIGKMVEEMENKIRQTLNSIYFGKTKDILNSLRNVENFQNRVRLQANFTGELQSALNRTRPTE
ncbi:unnamed protein product [Rotaria sordida]|uniref:F-actin-capping protein subunit beta n=1 Tax=Rotaria sordida TaxID=392033 RepID=A0A814SFQ4_9BILA|nr:unnamed protein product [Rotaria sordida]